MPGLGRSVTGLLWIEKKCGLLFILMGIRKLPTTIGAEKVCLAYLL